MSLTPAASAIYQDYLGDAETAALFTDAAELAALIEVEAALARAEAICGVIPADAGQIISAALSAVRLDPGALAKETASAGVVIPPFVAALRAALPEAVRPYLHWGATSQDIIDTGLVLRLRDALAITSARLDRLITQLVELTEAHRTTLMVARTRFQQATPTTFGLKAVGWAAPLGRHRMRLAELRPRLLRLQFAGASGNLAALGEKGPAVVDALARELDLTAATSWHTQRDTIAELGSWYALVAGSLGKIGTDLVAMARSEVAELRPGAGGGSSTMPQKANPVAPEALITLARWNAGLAGTLMQAMVQEHERDGGGWSLEWLALPQMAVASAGGLRIASDIFDALEVNAERMARNLAASDGLVMAEGAAFALAEHMPRQDAQALVKGACVQVREQGRHLADVLREMTEVSIDWDALRDGSSYVGPVDALIERTLREAKLTG